MISKTTHLFRGSKLIAGTVNLEARKVLNASTKSTIVAHYQNNQPVLNISLKELKSLLAKTGTEFDNFAKTIAGRILNIPKLIAPKLRYVLDTPKKGIRGGYDPRCHRIGLQELLKLSTKSLYRTAPDKKVTGIEKKLTRLKLIIHEMRHAKQSIDILRTEGLSDKWIHYIANRRAVQEVKTFHNKYKNKTLEEFLQFANEHKWSKANIDYFSQYFYAKAESPEKLARFLVHMKQEYVPFYKRQFQNFRSNILKVLPEIKQGTPEAEYNKALCKNLRHYIPFEEDEILNKAQLVELDAEYVAQKMRLDALGKMPKFTLREGKRLAAIFNQMADFKEIVLK